MAERPYVFVNMAMTADGKIDTVERRGARISGPADTARVDALRAASDAVMVGGHTLLAEDPRLTVRSAALVADRAATGRPQQPMKVGVVSHLQLAGERAIPPDGDFLRAGNARVVLCTSARTDAGTVTALEAQGAEVIVAGEDEVALPHALRALSDLGVERLMVEGGSTLVAALFAADLVDELQLAMAPLLFGGETAPTPVGGPGWTRETAPRLELAETDSSPDGDVIVRYIVPGGRRR